MLLCHFLATCIIYENSDAVKKAHQQVYYRSLKIVHLQRVNTIGLSGRQAPPSRHSFVTQVVICGLLSTAKLLKRI